MEHSALLSGDRCPNNSARQHAVDVSPSHLALSGDRAEGFTGQFSDGSLSSTESMSPSGEHGSPSVITPAQPLMAISGQPHSGALSTTGYAIANPPSVDMGKDQVFNIDLNVFMDLPAAAARVVARSWAQVNQDTLARGELYGLTFCGLLTTFFS